jgi:hypothetical protein|tara:strand:+ start:1163 stop:1420 length:258 start_codon:yes stop_codon:yes gene_type:complete
MAVSQKIINTNGQPSGAEGIVSIAGARGLTPGDKIGANNTVSPFPPLLNTQIDMSIANIDGLLDGRYSIVQAYTPNSPSGVAVSP